MLKLNKTLHLLLIATLLTACQPPTPQATPTTDPSTRLIAFNSFRDGHGEIYTMKADGSKQTRLTVFKDGDNFLSSWSPDGKRIAFVFKQYEEALVYVMQADGSHQINLTNAYLTGNFDVAVNSLPRANIAIGEPAPGDAAEGMRLTLFDAQLAIGQNSAQASAKLTAAESVYSGEFANAIKATAPTADARIRDGFTAAAHAVTQADVPAFAAARAQIWTGILAGGYVVVQDALKEGKGPRARDWLAVREFPVLTTRFSHPSVSAMLTVSSFANGASSSDDTLAAVNADLLDAYQSRLNQSLSDLAKADTNGFAARRAELAALAEGYFLILAPAYRQQCGAQNADAAAASFANLRANALSGKNVPAALQTVDDSLRGFRAQPLGLSEQSRRSGQLMRFLSLIAFEYKRGVSNGQVVNGLEIQEATTFHAGAYAAFSDLEYLLEARNPVKTAQARDLLNALDTELSDTAKQTVVTDSPKVQSQIESLISLLKEIMPAEWASDVSRPDLYEIYDAYPAWSPDGKKIAFASNEGLDVEAGGSLNIYLMNTDGSGTLKLTDYPNKYTAAPAWSPDGKRIAFTTDHDSDLEIYQMNADGSGLMNLTHRPNAFDQSPAWSPDGTKIVFASTQNEQTDIYVMNTDGSGLINLTNTPHAYDVTPQWSPDGSKIVFATNRDGNMEIYVMNADGSGQTNLTHNPGEDSDPAWQP